MDSEDLFEDFSEEVIAELDQDNVGQLDQDNVGQLVASTVHQPITNGDETKIVDQTPKLFQLPLTRIRNIMKLDPDLHLASNDAVFAVTRATELFIESAAREAFSYTAQAKKKTVQKRDVEMAISAVDSLMFLDGAMNF